MHSLKLLNLVKLPSLRYVFLLAAPRPLLQICNSFVSTPISWTWNRTRSPLQRWMKEIYIIPVLPRTSKFANSWSQLFTCTKFKGIAKDRCWCGTGLTNSFQCPTDLRVCCTSLANIVRTITSVPGMSSSQCPTVYKSHRQQIQINRWSIDLIWLVN